MPNEEQPKPKTRDDLLHEAARELNYATDEVRRAKTSVAHLRENLDEAIVGLRNHEDRLARALTAFDKARDMKEA